MTAQDYIEYLKAGPSFTPEQLAACKTFVPKRKPIYVAVMASFGWLVVPKKSTT